MRYALCEFLSSVDAKAAGPPPPEVPLPGYQKVFRGPSKTMASFFDTDTPLPGLAETFDEFGLSSSVLRGLKRMNFKQPTPVQSQTIPIALQGRDVCASSVTGTGKTAAFLVPTVERLLRHFPETQRTRAIVLSPTRELATQTFGVLQQLTQFTSLTALLMVGGVVSPKDEEERLLKCPDIIVATPGRLVDHLKNCKKFTLEHVEVFILDEADRLLDEGFMPQIEAVCERLPEERQALLVTATMTSSVSKLSELALRNPVRIALDEMFSVSENLKQEFVRVEKGNRMASLLAVCSRLCTKKTVIFFFLKKTCHRVFATFQALGMPAVELHGDMSQARRYESLAAFSSGDVEFLLASDIAARGLDISGVENVINYNMPRLMSHYIHRVGRTARIGHEGRAVSLIGEEERELMREIIQKSQNPVHKRTIPDDVLDACQEKLDSVTEKVNEILLCEREAAAISNADREINRAREIASNPAALPQKKRIYIDKEKKPHMHITKVASRIERLKQNQENKQKPKPKPKAVEKEKPKQKSKQKQPQTKGRKK